MRIGIGSRLLVKYEGRLQRGSVTQIFMDDLDIRLDDGEIIIRKKFWEVRKILSDDIKEEQ